MDTPQDPPLEPSQSAQLQADTAWLNSIRQRIPSPSRRNPNMSWQLNIADLIERQMQEDGHRLWGFVIYRTTYDSDADWTEFLSRLRFQMEDVFDYYNGRDILEKFSLTVMEDNILFNGASADTVRRHFQQWTIEAYQSEQQLPGQAPERISIGRSPRYRFAVQVDTEALHSVVYEAPAPPAIDTTTKGWVKVIDKSWYLGRGESSHEDRLEPIEGMTQHDLGWMKAPYKDVMTACYTQCRSVNYWTTTYCRPPKVAGSK